MAYENDEHFLCNLGKRYAPVCSINNAVLCLSLRIYCVAVSIVVAVSLLTPSYCQYV